MMKAGSTMPHDEAALFDIAGAATRILNFVAGLTKEDFLKDIKTRSAVLHQLLVLGEGTKRLSVEFRIDHSDIQWQLLAGMRDVLIHAYDTVDLDEVWKTATKDVPDLLSNIQPLLPNDHG
jgi:uncharacterized protein with HEPN domain